MKSESPVMAKKSNKLHPDFEDYEVKDAADTLMKSEEIKQNKKLHGAAMKHLAKKGKAIDSLQKLRSIAAEKLNGKPNNSSAEDIDQDEEAVE